MKCALASDTRWFSAAPGKLVHSWRQRVIAVSRSPASSGSIASRSYIKATQASSCVAGVKSRKPYFFCKPFQVVSTICPTPAALVVLFGGALRQSATYWCVLMSKCWRG
jgi:hypothetical protein